MENLKDLAKLVKKTRDAQKTFFREARKGNATTKNEALKQSKSLEAELDATVDGILNPVNKDQQSMF